MSTMVDQKPLTAGQRTTRASEIAAGLLGLDNAKLLGPILAEAALIELRHNPTFADRVRRAYEAEAPKPKPKRTTRPTQPKAKAPKPELKPIKRIETHEINIAAALDPYYLLDVYGADQLSLALEEYTADKLYDEAVQIVQKRHPGTKPRSKASKKAIIEYIVRYVAAG